MNQSWNVRAHGRKLALGLALSGLTVVLAQGGCASSDTPEFILLPDAGNGSGNSATGGSSNSGNGGSVGAGGSTNTGGSFATGGSFGSGGSSATGGTIGTGGTFGSGGSTGSGGARATGGTTGTGGTFGSGGSTGSGGARATGGTTGSGGMMATGGSTGSGGSRATGGTSGSGGSGGTAATFTQIYQQILSVSCTGSQCHSPGTQGGVSFSSQSNAYNAVKSRVTAGNATGSSFYTTVNTGRMPPGGKLSSSQLQMIASWINAGAMNN